MPRSRGQAEVWRFEDKDGSVWDVALGRESWGVICALFVPQVGAGVRQLHLHEATERDAHAALDRLKPESWQELLEKSLLKQ